MSTSAKPTTVYEFVMVSVETSAIVAIQLGLVWVANKCGLHIGLFESIACLALFRTVVVHRHLRKRGEG